MLVLMTVTHLPTRFASWVSQPFGYVSAAEGFVFLSAFLVGSIYTERALKDGPRAMRGALWRRAYFIYLCHAAMLLFLFTVIAAIGIETNRQAIKNLISFYLQEPLTALWTGFALIYNPPLLDILPMYVLFMLATPGLLSLGLRGHWPLIMGASVLVWLLAQYDLSAIAYATIVRATQLKVPLHQTGAFELVAWQFIWVLGLWMGASLAASKASPAVRFPKWLLGTALAIGLGCLLWRHALGQAPFGANVQLNVLFDKWKLGPLRVLDFFALLVLFMHFGPKLAARVRLGFLEVLGAASLPVFCAHLVIALLAISVLGDKQEWMAPWRELLLLSATFAVLYAVAWLSRRGKTGARAAPAVPPVTVRTA